MSRVSKRLTDARNAEAKLNSIVVPVNNKFNFTKDEAIEYQKTKKIMSNRKDMDIQIKDTENAMDLLRTERNKIRNDPSKTDSIKTEELQGIKKKMDELNIQYTELNSLNGPGNPAYSIYDGGGIKRKVVKRKVISIQSAKASRPVKPTTRKPIKPTKPTVRKPTKRPTKPIKPTTRKPTTQKPTIVRRK
jgi:hypothetical protein